MIDPEFHALLLELGGDVGVGDAEALEGVADPDSGRLVTPDDPARIASIRARASSVLRLRRWMAISADTRWKSAWVGASMSLTRPAQTATERPTASISVICGGTRACIDCQSVPRDTCCVGWIRSGASSADGGRSITRCGIGGLSGVRELRYSDRRNTRVFGTSFSTSKPPAISPYKVE